MIINMTGGGAAKPKLTSIAVTTNPTKTDYNAGDSFSTNGMIVTAYFDDGSSSVVSGYTYSPTTLSAGTTAVTISYSHEGVTKTATVAVKVTWYLYDNGTENTAWTIAGDALKESNRVKLGFVNWNAGTMYTNTTIDLSKYSKLSLRHTTTDVSGDYGGIAITTDSSHLGNTNITKFPYKTKTPTGTSIVTEIDLSSITQSMYIFISSHNNYHHGSGTYVQEVWLTP